MKVSFLFGSLGRGGAERVIASLANSYAEQGYEVEIVTLGNQSPGYQLSDKVKVVCLDAAGVSQNALQAFSRNIKAVMALRKYVKRAKPDSVVAFSMRLANQVLLASPIRRKYRVVVSERANPRFASINTLEKILRKLVLPKADAFIFQTDRVQQCFPEKIRKKGRTIHNGVFNQQIPEVPIDFTERNLKKICAVGRITKQKGYDVLLRAFADFQVTHEDYKLHIYGEGPDRDKLEKLAREIAIDKHVIFHGNISGLIDEIKDAGMFVMASRFEGMPNALMEAMACGIPCVSTDCDFGPGELIQSGENGLLVPVDDQDALAAAMKKVADDPSFARKIGTNALEIRISHSPEQIIQMYKDVIFI